MIRGRPFFQAVLLAAAATATVRAQETRAASPRVGPDPALTIEQAVRAALEKNLNILAERFNLKVADTAIVTASLKPNPVVTVNMIRPDRTLVDAGVSPYEQVFRTDYVLERGEKRERRVDQATLSRAVAGLQLAN